jgi:hypothetical protein
MGELGCSQQCLQSIKASSTLTRFEQWGLKKNNEKNKKNKEMSKPWTISYTLVLQSMSSRLSLFFLGMDQLVFLPKWCHVSQITIWFVLILNPCLNALILYLFCVLLQITIISVTCPIHPSLNSKILIFLNFYWIFNNKNYSEFNSWHTLSLETTKPPLYKILVI